MTKRTLGEVKREIEVLESDIMSIEVRIRELRKEEEKLRNKAAGLVPYETMVREIKRYGHNAGKPGRLGQFVKFYSKFGLSDWAIVLLVNKDGKVGLRKTTFYQFEKEDA